MKRRCLSFLLALCMLLTFLPAPASADENPAADADTATPETADASATQDSAENSDLASEIAFPPDDANAVAFQTADASAEGNGAETEISIVANPDTQISEYAELMAANVTYANYSGVNYANVGLSSERVATLNKAMRMVTIQWTAIESFRTWCSSAGSYNTAVAIDGTSSTYFQAGKTYTGIPYSMANHTFDDIAWKNYVESGSITKSNMSATYYSHSKETTACGVDCSYFVYLAIREAVGSSNISYQTTATMISSTTYYEKLTGISDMIPGDLFLTNGHVMMYVGRSGNKYAVFEADADDAKCSYNEYASSSLSSYGCYRYKGFGTVPIVNTFERDTRYPVPITAYPAQTSGKVTVYDNSLNAYSTSSRWIDYNDQCSITAVYTNGFCRVTYPSSSGSANAYAKWSSFSPNAVTPYSWSPSSNVTSYKKSNMSEKIGEVYATDSCTVVGASGNTLQVIYPVSGGYKLGWVENSSPNPKATLDINGLLDGNIVGWITDYGTFDIQVGDRFLDDVSDFCEQVPVGTAYKITDIKATDGHVYQGSDKALEGTVNDTTEIALKFDTLYGLDVNGFLDGNTTGWISGYGTFDVQVGNRLLDDVSDFCEWLPCGTAYKITDVKALGGRIYQGSEGSLEGVLNATTAIVLKFDTDSYLINPIVYNADYYRSKHKDLQEAFGDNDDALLYHWLTIGIDEGRQASPAFSPMWYMNRHKDVATALGEKNYRGAVAHFFEHGAGEWRETSEEFFVNIYRENYKDLRNSFEDDVYAYFLHYINYGKAEGRIANKRLDEEPPKVTNANLTNVSTNKCTLTVTATDNVGVDHVNFHAFYGKWTAAGETVYHAVKSGNNWSYDVPLTLSNGQDWSVDARIYDAAGNQALAKDGYPFVVVKLRDCAVTFDANGGSCGTSGKSVISASYGTPVSNFSG